LFTGPRGVGKTTTARLLAKALNCESGPTAEPCNDCSTCREIAEGIAFDVLEIDGASHTQVDKMRELMEAVSHRPIKSRFKVYIIDEVHMLSQHSFNALLKTLEEPPPHVKFVLATTDPHKILPTVLSRCQRYDLRRIGLGDLIGHLTQTARAEKVVIPDEALALIAREAQGSLRDAQSLLEQVLAAGAAAQDEPAVRAILGAADRRLVLDVAESILRGDAPGCLRHLTTLYDHGYDAHRFCRDLLEYFRQLAVLAATEDASLLADVPEREREALRGQVVLRSADDMQRCFGLLLDTDEVLSTPARTVDPQLVLEMRVLRLATLPPLLPAEEIVRRLELLAGGQGGDSGGGTAPGVGRAGATRSPSGATSGATTRGRAATGDEFWTVFLERVRNERVSLYMALAGGRLVERGEDQLTIGIESAIMRAELGGRETVARLEALASEVLGRPVTVEIGPLPAAQVAETPRGRAKQRSEETLADPMVQAAVEIFGAEVRGVRERRP
jgi:DNA polymerase-3 subunit gamma/tau